MDISSQDALRLNVLLASRPQAIRINENTLTVFGLAEKGEAQVQLNPTGRHEQYVKRVRELLSGQVLGSPGGYPVYLQRWTRMGQMRDESLEQLLLLGEPEAVVATVCAPGLTDELARRAWWAMEDAGNARQMLKKRAVVEGRMGPVLASYLVEHLPFETEPEQQIETVCLVLQPGLLAPTEIESLWRKAQRKPAYYVGFLMARPDMLPMGAGAHPLFGDLHQTLDGLAAGGSQLAGLLARVLSAPGQAFLDTVFKVFEKPSNQEVVNLGLMAIAAYFAPARPEGPADATIEVLVEEADCWLRQGGDVSALLALPGMGEQLLLPMRVLSGVGYGVVRPVFCDTTAIGSLMRRKLQPVLDPVLDQLGRLHGGVRPARPRASQ